MQVELEETLNLQVLGEHSPQQYALTSIIAYSGCIGTGHYTAYCKHGTLTLPKRLVTIALAHQIRMMTHP